MKKWIQRMLSLLLCLLLVSQVGAVTLQHPFADVPKDAWYLPAVQYAYTNRLFAGISERSFAPNAQMTRAMFVTVLWRACASPLGYTNSYSDVPAATWYTDAVSWAAGKGIVDGIGNGKFAPSNGITREQLAVILHSYCLAEGLELPSETKEETPFTDADGISTWAIEAVRWAAEKGIVNGIPDGDGVCFAPKRVASRAEVAQMMMGFLGEDTVPFATELCYGISGSGKYPLTAYRLGSGKNVMVLSFAVHGWEDGFDRDGQALVEMADHLFQTLCAQEKLIDEKDWTVYILRCVNPDGLYLGRMNNGPGRCTTTYYDESGRLVQDGKLGIDINRCFPYEYVQETESRNFNGTAPLQCAEAQALASFTEQVKGDGHCVLIDTHGWFDQIITSSGKGKLFRAFAQQFPSGANGYARLSRGKGYYSSWAAFVLGYDSCLFELPPVVEDMEEFRNSDLIARFETVILGLLSDYQGAEPTPEDVKSARNMSLNGN